jgi:hypothetical protein
VVGDGICVWVLEVDDAVRNVFVVVLVEEDIKFSVTILRPVVMASNRAIAGLKLS